MRYDSIMLDIITKARTRPNGRKLRRMERGLERTVGAEFEKQKSYVLKKTRALLNKKSVKSYDDDADEIFFGLDDAGMVDGIISDAEGAMKFGGDYRAKKLRGIGISFDIGHPLSVEYLQTDRPLVLAKIAETTKEHLKPILIEALKSGASYQDTAKLISENFAFSKDRSLMIAVNEIGHAYEYGNFVTMKTAEEEGYDSMKYWSTVRDDRVTDECNENEEEGWIAIDDDFPSGDATPPRTDNPRCRCTALYEIREKE